MKKILVSLMAAGFLAVGATAWAVDAGSGAAAIDAQSAHNANEAKGTCAKCHIPHGGKGAKIWAQVLTGVASFSGIHQLCNSCHYGTGGTYLATSGLTNVFTKGAYWNHSMLNWANTAGAGITMPTGFPLNTTDTDTIWTAADPDGVNTNLGFYCGTCHNPHKQPVLGGAGVFNGNGDYLRVDGTQTVVQFGTSGARDGACTQCHTAAFTGTVATGHQGNCTQCHAPHRGRVVATGAGNAIYAEKILTVNYTANPFTATPNVTGFTAGSYSEWIANTCYGCHKNTTAGGGGLPDLDTQITSLNEHHPMGTSATIGAAGHAPGYAATIQFTCNSCHDAHNASQDFYLRGVASGPWPISGTYASYDDGGYCTDQCHTNKAVSDLGTPSSAHSWTTANTKGAISGRGTCFVCHFIHDGAARGTVARADINAMMRVLPVNKNDANLFADADVNDYEDMCNGCHSTATITTGTGTAGSQFNGAYFTHRYAGTITAGLVTRMAALAPVLPVAANTTTGGGEYGATAGQLYCGTCHNVHVQNTADAQGGMFRRTHYNNATDFSNLCVDCHTSTGMAGGTAHPTYLDGIAPLPNAPLTAASIPAQYGNGGDGMPGGRTGGGTPGGAAAATGALSCETCHNFHTSNTDIYGSTVENGSTLNKGKILIMDNKSNATGSNMCAGCHGTSY